MNGGELPELRCAELSRARYQSQFAVAETAATGVRVLCLTDDQDAATKWLKSCVVAGSTPGPTGLVCNPDGGAARGAQTLKWASAGLAIRPRVLVGGRPCAICVGRLQPAALWLRPAGKKNSVPSIVFNNRRGSIEGTTGYWVRCCASAPSLR